MSHGACHMIHGDRLTAVINTYTLTHICTPITYRCIDKVDVTIEERLVLFLFIDYNTTTTAAASGLCVHYIMHVV